MSDRPPLAAPVQGWVQFAGDPAWSAARFATSISGRHHHLHIERNGAGSISGRHHHLHIERNGAGAISIDLADVTTLDELPDRPDGQQHLEIEVQRSPAVQVVWPPAFTDLVLTSLRATLETQDESAAVVPERGRRAHGALIGALALVGCGAIVLGAVGLTDPEPSRPAETSVLTQTTLRGPAETLATTSTTTTTSTPSLDDCAAGPAGPGTTIAPEAADGCEPG